MNLQELYKKLPIHIRSPNPDIYLSDNFAVIDFETTNEDKGSYGNLANHVVSLSLWDNNTGEFTTVECSEFDAPEYFGDLRRFDYIVAHNARFEAGWLERCSYDWGELVFACTQLAEYTIQGNRPEGRYASLEYCARARGLGGKNSAVSRLIKAGVNPANISSRYLLRYNEQDTLVERDLWLLQREEMRAANLLPVFYTKNLFVPVLAEIELRGLYLDSERVEAVHRKNLTRLWELQSDWDELTGGVNIKSPKQKAELFYDTLGFKVPKGARTATGAPKTDTITLSRLEPKTEKQKQVLSVVRELTKLVDNQNKILSKLHTCVTEDDGVVRFRINQTATSTHRLSSTGQKYAVQGQNIHREFKPLYRARKNGWKLAEIDQDGLEFRTAGHLGRDEQVREDILGGVDPHEQSGRIIFSDEWRTDEPAKSPHNAPLRQQAKAHTFKPLYGGSKGTPKEEEWFAEFRRRYSGIAQQQEKWADEVIRRGYLVHETGLRFYWPGTIRFQNGSASNFQAICNYPVQYFATGDSGIVTIAVIIQWYLLRAARMESFICNTIHDSSIAEVHPDELEDYKTLSEFAFTEGVSWYLKRVYGIELFIPLSAEVQYYDHWSDSEEWQERWLGENDGNRNDCELLEEGMEGQDSVAGLPERGGRVGELVRSGGVQPQGVEEGRRDIGGGESQRTVH